MRPNGLTCSDENNVSRWYPEVFLARTDSFVAFHRAHGCRSCSDKKYAKFAEGLRLKVRAMVSLVRSFTISDALLCVSEGALIEVESKSVEHHSSQAQWTFCSRCKQKTFIYILTNIQIARFPHLQRSPRHCMGYGWPSPLSPPIMDSGTKRQILPIAVLPGNVGDPINIRYLTLPRQEKLATRYLEMIHEAQASEGVRFSKS